MGLDVAKRLTSNGIVYNKDSRELDEILKQKVVDVTITSPPYFDLKDYGHKAQIGYGQDYKQYLKDLQAVFGNVYNCTKDSGTLWVVIDAFRRENEVIPLPFDFSNAIKQVGWKLQDIIIWAKDRTVPWAHQGQMRNLFEYILVFSKQEKYNFFIDDVRDFETLKKWWVKYPERYNPKGKTPDGLWHFDIPTQGSWGSGYIKHFCPLPEELIEQILKISTKEGDTVLDPFAGSGAVLAKADNMQRKYIGFELNKSYIKMFHSYLKKTGVSNRRKYLTQKSKQLPQDKFSRLITDLRALKFARVIFSKLPQTAASGVQNIYVERLKKKPSKKNAIVAVKYIFYTSENLNVEKLMSLLLVISDKAPLSKYGIQAEFLIKSDRRAFLKAFSNRNIIYSYTTKVTHKFQQEVARANISRLPKSQIILSSIRVDLNEKDYE